ncbi:conserved hypothetical protein [Leishmania major strain Friedlin]|uniref:Uncharacterized protein n=1 Tax=Leishmania major TaxID=5664 RepID=Q4Q5S7_LEIMA|nr:conserved hypothetical protein [Leishmania major strain Friedlin]CAG9579930.1 hypothetical_protein_-_conserved [Leishmania major strain Friedlin]CAJ08449.1 conserved hypothetical protein [Leishmania major strain Friedlin]|eukprot:XP_001685321.1 conserved hypothetical protein [Leishmania major strain Friedlin]
MGGSSDTIGVRTKHDREEEERDRKLMERIMKENQNPFQALVDPLLEQASYMYNTYLYASGVMFLTLAFWGAYPSFVRFRHAHIFRYRRRQLSFRRGLFATEHMPKWNKNRLQRIVVPPLPTFDLVAVDSAAASPVHPTLFSCSAATGNVSVVAAADTTVTTGAASNLDRRFDVMELSATRTSHGSFGAGDTEKSERALIRELQRINRDFFGPQSQLFYRAIPEHAATGDLRQRLKAAVATAKAVVVLVENHSTVRSIPEGWEVWWVSEPEARRRRFCKFWLGGLLCARAFQDLMDMPDMPDFIN